MAQDASITVEQGTGCLRVGGLVALMFALLGVVLLVTDSRGGDPFWVAGMLFMVMVTAPLGVLMMFGRAGVTVDVQAGQVRAWRRILGVTVQEVVTPLTSLRNVAILRERVRGQETFNYLYHVRLVGPAASVELVAPARYDDARNHADALVKATRLTLIDGELRLPPKK